MGQSSRDHLSSQRVYVAWQADQPLAFASFHQSPQEWALDVMRHRAGLPNGTLQSLVLAAIDDAARERIARLSLAAVPEAAFNAAGHCHTKLLHAMAGADGAGLVQFKSAFAPRWRRLYLAAPNRACLPLAAASSARAILHLPPIEQDHADYEFASAPDPWHRRG